MKRNLKIKPIYECRCNGRLQTKRFMRLTHTGLVVELEDLKIKTRIIDEMFLSVMGEGANMFVRALCLEVLFINFVVYYESMKRNLI